MFEQGNIAVALTDDIPALGKRKGQIIQLALSPSDVNSSEEIDTYLGGYSPPGFRFSEAAPPVLVVKDFDDFRNYGSNNAFKLVQTETSKQSGIKEVDAESSLSSYQVIEHALGAYIPGQTQVQAAPLVDPRMAGARRISWALELGREVRGWGLLTTSGNWNADNTVTLAAGSEWNDAINGNPIKDLFARIEASAQIVTDIWFSTQVSHAFIQNQNVRDHVRLMRGDLPSAESVAAADAQVRNIDFVIPGLPPFHVVPGKVLNESTGKLDYILADNVVLTTTPTRIPTDATEIFTAMTFRRRGSSGTGYLSREVELATRGLEVGRLLVAGFAEDIKFVANNCGGLIKDVIQ